MRNDHLGEDPSQDELTKGREEEQSPVKTKDVDPLGMRVGMCIGMSI